MKSKYARQQGEDFLDWIERLHKQLTMNDAALADADLELATIILNNVPQLIQKAKANISQGNIRHRVFHEGNVQSVGFIDEQGMFIMTAGVANPGTYSFGIASRRETIEVTSGKILVNGLICLNYDRKIIEVGHEIVFQVIVPSSYTCTYG